MIDPTITGLARDQEDLFGIWQLVAKRWTPDQIRHRTKGLERAHDGVVRLGTAPLTALQRQWAATLTAPETYLSHASLLAFTGVRSNPGRVEVVTRRGRRGRQLIGRVLVLWSCRLEDEDLVCGGGPPRLTVERTLLDLTPTLPPTELRKAVREALRLRRTTPGLLLATLDRHPRRAGAATLRQLADRYSRLPIERCKSDAEAYALELLDAGGYRIPLVNVYVAGEEADQVHPDLKRIIEIDGPGYHVLRDEDARKTAIWRKAGFTVDRVSSDDVFDHPDRYLAIAPR